MYQEAIIQEVRACLVAGVGGKKGFETPPNPPKTPKMTTSAPDFLGVGWGVQGLRRSGVEVYLGDQGISST